VARAGSEVEALMARIDATYPTFLSPVERKMRVQEWLDSSVASFDWNDVGRVAWRRWKDNRDRAPTPFGFAEVCRAIENTIRLSRPRIETAATPEQMATNVEMARLARQVLKRADDE
jgi:hypothetical protein